LTPSASVTNNAQIVRKMVALALSLAIQVAALHAPLVHAHPDDHDTDHHHGRAIHSHWSAHPLLRHDPDRPTITEIDDDHAIALNAFVAASSSSVYVPADVAGTFTVAVPDERRAHRIAETVRSHDPPASQSLSPRAPPLILS
jgi:hypothetical protein